MSLDNTGLAKRCKTFFVSCTYGEHQRIVVTGKNVSTSNVVLLLCAGDGTRWGEYLGVPKQLIGFGGEPLLSRTVRHLREFGVPTQPICVTHDPRLHLKHTVPFRPVASRWTVETLASTRPLWRDRTIVLLGDVFFTRRALRRVLRTEDEVVFFGRRWPSAYTMSDHGEIFALSFSQKRWDLVLRACATVARVAKAKQNAWGNLWDLYHTITGFPLGCTATEDNMFTIIDDMTSDFDTPHAYTRCEVRYRWAASGSVLDKVRLLMALCVSLPQHVPWRLGWRVPAPRKSPSEYFSSRFIIDPKNWTTG